MNLKKYNVILASNSPRRKALLAGLDIPFDIKVIPDVDESYPSDLPKEEVAKYIATKKAEAYQPTLNANDLLITADTVVVLGEEVISKPIDANEAKVILRKLSGKTHSVITGVTINTVDNRRIFDVVSKVRFANLSDDEIEYYVDKYNPTDKAGAYGIQEWIGYVAVEHIEGSYFNIMGLPVQRLYQELKKMKMGL